MKMKRLPQRLKPDRSSNPNGTTEVVPFPKSTERIFGCICGIDSAYTDYSPRSAANVKECKFSLVSHRLQRIHLRRASRGQVRSQQCGHQKDRRSQREGTEIVSAHLIQQARQHARQRKCRNQTYDNARNREPQSLAHYHSPDVGLSAPRARRMPSSDLRCATE